MIYLLYDEVPLRVGKRWLHYSRPHLKDAVAVLVLQQVY